MKILDTLRVPAQSDLQSCEEKYNVYKYLRQSKFVHSIEPKTLEIGTFNERILSTIFNKNDFSLECFGDDFFLRHELNSGYCLQAETKHVYIWDISTSITSVIVNVHGDMHTVAYRDDSGSWISFLRVYEYISSDLKNSRFEKQQERIGIDEGIWKIGHLRRDFPFINDKCNQITEFPQKNKSYVYHLILESFPDHCEVGIFL